MREYILLLLIALVGIAGLLTIHHEVQLSENDQASFLRASSISSVPIMTSAVQPKPVQLIIEDGLDTESINLRINNYDPEADYYLDSGDGQKTKVSSPLCSVTYQRSGVFLVKLLKNNILEDVIAITIPPADIHADEMVTYQVAY